MGGAEVRTGRELASLAGDCIANVEDLRAVVNSEARDVVKGCAAALVAIHPRGGVLALQGLESDIAGWSRSRSGVGLLIGVALLRTVVHGARDESERDQARTLLSALIEADPHAEWYHVLRPMRERSGGSTGLES